MITLSDGKTVIESLADNGSIDAALSDGSTMNESQWEEYSALKRAKLQSFTVSVPSEYIAVLKLFAAKNDVRYYLNGINLEVFPAMENGYCDGRLVATNGHMLGVFKLTGIDAQTDTALTDIIIPLDLLTWKANPTLPVLITVGPCEPDSTSRSISLTQGLTSISGKSIDGRFPGYRQIFP